MNNDLSEHQKSILIALLQGKRIARKMFINSDEREIVQKTRSIFEYLIITPHNLSIAPHQDVDVIRLTGQASNTTDEYVSFSNQKFDGDTHYIDISPHGFIVGGKIEDIAK